MAINQGVEKTPLTIVLDSPRPDDKQFTKYWDMFILDVSMRENLKPGHLVHLKIYCGMLCQADSLETILDESGHTWESEGGRNGPQVKLRPESATYLNVIKEIRQYSVMLGLTLVKDTKMTNDQDEAKDSKEKEDTW